MPDAFLQKSVTANEITTVKNGAVINLVVPFYQGYDRLSLPPQAPPYWSLQRDAILRATVHHEAMWAAAVGIAISKLAALSFNVISKKPRLAKEAQDILINADGERVGWVGFISKVVRDYLTTDNGTFIEVVRATKSPGSKVLGLRHLDSMRITRTGDPAIPALYRDRWGKIHEMKDYQIIMFSDMPDPSETYYGVGMCAASRCYGAIYKLASIEWYLREKVSGLHPLAIHIVNGVLDQQLKGAIDAAKQEEISRGLVAYMGAVIVGIPAEQQPMVATIPLAELPDRFQRKEEFDLSMLTYADSIGLDIQELQPLSSGNLGNSTQSQMLHDKARGKGLTAFRQDFTHAMNHYVLPDGVEFEWLEKDYRDLTQKEDITTKRVANAQARITAQITTPAQELQLLVDEDELPKEFLTVDHTPEENLGDNEDADDQEAIPTGAIAPLGENAGDRIAPDKLGSETDPKAEPEKNPMAEQAAGFPGQQRPKLRSPQTQAQIDADARSYSKVPPQLQIAQMQAAQNGGQPVGKDGKPLQGAAVGAAQAAADQNDSKAPKTPQVSAGQPQGTGTANLSEPKINRVVAEALRIAADQLAQAAVVQSGSQEPAQPKNGKEPEKKEEEEKKPPAGKKRETSQNKREEKKEFDPEIDGLVEMTLGEANTLVRKVQAQVEIEKSLKG